MATVLQTSPFMSPPSQILKNSSSNKIGNCVSVKLSKPSIRFSFRETTSNCHSFIRQTQQHNHLRTSLRFVNFVSFASSDGTETVQTGSHVQEPEIEESSDGAVGIEDGPFEMEDVAKDEEVVVAEETTASVILASLRSYKEALASNDESRIAEVEAFLMSVENEKVDLERKVLILTEELAVEKDRIVRISADFDNFRKRTERERLSLVTNAQGEVLENLLPVLDNFERAKDQIKVETEGEEKINNSYQSIYKQFIEILGSLGVVPVETIRKPFDPLLHEAIMREESAEFEEGIIIQEFRKGFKLGDRLLRPSMVKVSAGPGPAKPEQEGVPSSETSEETQPSSETIEESGEHDSA